MHRTVLASFFTPKKFIVVKNVAEAIMANDLACPFAKWEILKTLFCFLAFYLCFVLLLWYALQ